MTQIYFVIIALLAGAFMPLQGAINARLNSHLNHPMQATFISFFVGTLACVLIIAFSAKSIPSVKQLINIDWKLYTGGLLGVFFVTMMLMLIPKLGFANVLSSVIVGQLIVSVIFDHYGLMNNPVIEISMTRIIGVMLLCAGLLLIQYTK